MSVDERMERKLDIEMKELDEMVKKRKLGRKIIIMKEEKMEKMRVIRNVIEKIGGGKEVKGKLKLKRRFRFKRGSSNGDLKFFVKRIIERKMILR